MRDVTRQITLAFINGKTLRLKNTRTDGQAIYLFDNLIAWKHNGSVYCTLAGWGSVTTRERLNGLAYMLTKRCPFYQRKNTQFYNGSPIGERDIITLIGKE